MYDFAHPLQDAIEGITHSLCSLEYENHRILYDWVVENCKTPHVPQQIEFGRLNITNTIMSKRYLRELVEKGKVEGYARSAHAHARRFETPRLHPRSNQEFHHRDRAFPHQFHVESDMPSISSARI